MGRLIRNLGRLDVSKAQCDTTIAAGNSIEQVNRTRRRLLQQGIPVPLLFHGLGLVEAAFLWDQDGAHPLGPAEAPGGNYSASKVESFPPDAALTRIRSAEL